MGPLDNTVVLFLNQLVHRSGTLDTFLFLCASSPILRGGIIATLLWWVWFKEGREQRRNREIVLYGIIACVGAVWLARAVSHMVPFRPRPIHNPELALRLADGLSSKVLLGWSSFPSDHAALFVCLAVCLCLASRSVGAWAAAEVLLVACLPRVILGIHYLSDVLAGGLIGTGVALLARSARVRSLVTGRALQWADRSPKHFYAAFFFATYMIGVVFDPLVPLLSFSAKVVRAALSRVDAFIAAVPVRIEWVAGAVLFLAAATLLVTAIRGVRTRRLHSHAQSK